MHIKSISFSVSPQPQEVPSRPDLTRLSRGLNFLVFFFFLVFFVNISHLTKGAKWMMEQGISAYISHEDVVSSELSKLLASKYCNTFYREFIKIMILRGSEAEIGWFSGCRKLDRGSG